MLRPALVLGLTLAAGAAAVAANSLAATPIALSASCCANFLSKIVFFNEPGNFGVPAYTMGMDALTYDLSDGASFSVSDGGASQTVVFQSSQFADIDQASMDEVIDAINGQLTIGHVLMDTGMLMVRGVAGGPDAQLTLTDGPGAPLAALAVPPATILGTEDIELLLDTEAAGMAMDEGEAQFMHLPYFVAMSHTPGTTDVLGAQVPIAIDTTTLLGLRATQFDLLPDFVGEIDHHGMANATFDTKLLAKLYPSGTPASLYFAFVVFSADFSRIVFVSNRFEAEIVD